MQNSLFAARATRRVGQLIATASSKRDLAVLIGLANCDGRQVQAQRRAVPLKLLKVEPVKGYSGDSFTVDRRRLPGGQEN